MMMNKHMRVDDDKKRPKVAKKSKKTKRQIHGKVE